MNRAARCVGQILREKGDGHLFTGSARSNPACLTAAAFDRYHVDRGDGLAGLSWDKAAGWQHGAESSVPADADHEEQAAEHLPPLLCQHTGTRYPHGVA